MKFKQTIDKTIDELKTFIDRCVDDTNFFSNILILKTIGALTMNLMLLLIIFFVIIFSIPLHIIQLILLPFDKLINKKSKNKVRKIINDYHKNQINASYTYYLKDYIHSHNYRLNTFVHFFIRSYKDNYSNYHSLTNIQMCDKGRRRSLGDIYLICKHYYPDCTLDEVLSILIKLVLSCSIQTSYCNTIHKLVFYGGYGYNEDSKVEYSNKLKLKDVINAYK